MLLRAAELRLSESVEQLIAYDVKVNLQVTAMGEDYGNTALHTLVSGFRAGDESIPQLEILEMLLAHPSTDPCVYNGLGFTPYMAVAAKHEKLLKLLRPKVTWADIEAVIGTADADLDTLAAALADLVNKAADLRLPDLLFCEHEGPEEELQRRRLMLWERFLKPITATVCPARALSRPEHDVYTYW